ncbi:MAG: RelA/SpoT family protein [Deltaproteobacteria bacterium]|jgi:(p)ppGpp synthase/HD superfamily hydrolase|nr:RelA/SpoT family protein [Deltaproteobacteria bacterium]
MKNTDNNFNPNKHGEKEIRFENTSVIPDPGQSFLDKIDPDLNINSQTDSELLDPNLADVPHTKPQVDDFLPDAGKDKWLGGTADIHEKPVEEYVPAWETPSYRPKAININEIIDIYNEYYPDTSPTNRELIRQAYTFAALVHQGATRLSGEPYLSHPLAVAHIIANMKLDAISIAAGLLHDTVEDTKTTLEDIKNNFGNEFGPQLATIIDGVTKIGKTNFSSKTARKAANLSKVVLASMKDLRVMLVKLADRLHNMRTLSYMRPEKQTEIAQETLDYFASFATRLGIHKIKSELEDLSLFYLFPKEYTEITKKLSIGQKAREEYVEKVINVLAKRLQEFGIPAEITGRNKHIYSIWRKMRQQKIPFEQIYDLFAFRIVVTSVENCYRVLGLVHTFFSPLPGRFKDYISVPKSNGYRSLHTAVVGPDNIRVEIQIRTEEMHSYSEDGVAAHWRYKVGSAFSNEEQELILKFRQTIAHAFSTDQNNPEEYLAELKQFLDSKELIYVFTPKGDIIKLPSGSTPIDFAFQIHTDVGKHCNGAFVDGSIVPLNHVLKNGDTIKILTNKNTSPTLDWLDRAVSPKARARIRQALAEQKLTQVPPPPEPVKPQISKPVHPKPQAPKNKGIPRVLVKGIEDISTRFAKCCNPIPGEPIIGFLTKTGYVSIHSKDCHSSRNLPKERFLEVSWNLADGEEFVSDVFLKIVHTEVPSGVPQIINAIASTKSTITEFKADRENPRFIYVRVAVADYGEYLKVLNSLNVLKGVVKSVDRITHESAAKAPTVHKENS